MSVKYRNQWTNLLSMRLELIHAFNLAYWSVLPTLPVALLQSSSRSYDSHVFCWFVLLFFITLVFYYCLGEYSSTFCSCNPITVTFLLSVLLLYHVHMFFLINSHHLHFTICSVWHFYERKTFRKIENESLSTNDYLCLTKKETIFSIVILIQQSISALVFLTPKMFGQ